MALCDMLIVVVIVAFALCYCSVEQHQALLRGQVLALFFSAHLLGSSQGEMIQPSQLKAGMIGTFVSILLAVVGALNTSYSFLSTASGRTKGRSSQRGFLSQFFIIVLLCSSVRQVGGTKPNDAGRKVTNSGSVYVQDLKEWIKARCGSDDEDGTADGVALWVYEGALWDPLEGRKVANVEGIEIVRQISSVGDSRNPENKKKYRNECGELEVGPLISHPNATFDHASTILSRKLFCYKAPDSSRKQQQQLLQSIKVRPNAPTRRIPTKQAVAVYETATTFIARGKELIAHTEWPDRQSIWGRATRNSPPSSDEYDSNGKNFDFTIYARQKSANKKKEQLFDLTQEPVADTEDPAHIISSPKRSKLIEFGTSSSTGKDKFGAREAYSYNIQGLSGSGDGMLQRMGLNRVSVNDRACTVRYTRYGEGPPFFGPGRICSLELQGRRISSLDEMPPLIRSLIANRMSPQFLSSYKDTAPEDRKQILRKFHSPKGSVLQVQPAEDEPSEFWLPTYLKEHGQVYWNKLQQKLTIAELGR